PRRHLRGARNPARDGRSLARRFLPLPVAVSGRAGLVDPDRRAPAPALAAVGRRVDPELRGGVRAHRRRSAACGPAGPCPRVIALLGSLSRDFLPGEAARTGGAPFHAARALKHLDVHALLFARCAESDRAELLPPVVALGSIVRYVPGATTASFELSY